LFDNEVPKHGSQFWNAIQKLKWYFKLGAWHKVQSGKRTYFWLDWWCGNGPLRARFPLLFSCCANPFVTVQGTRVIGGTPREWRILFRRQMDLPELVEWDNLCREVQGLPIEETEDIVTWALEPSGQFSTNSMYMCLS
jgi:hypothetical protein